MGMAEWRNPIGSLAVEERTGLFVFLEGKGTRIRTTTIQIPEPFKLTVDEVAFRQIECNDQDWKPVP